MTKVRQSAASAITLIAACLATQASAQSAASPEEEIAALKRQLQLMEQKLDKLQKQTRANAAATAKATAAVDVYVVGSNNTGVGGPGPRPTAEGSTPPRPPEPQRPQTPSQRHFTMANLAGYPAINLPNGFADTGTPTNATIYAQPYRELEVIALAKAYQDAAKHHLVMPKLA